MVKRNTSTEAAEDIAQGNSAIIEETSPEQSEASASSRRRKLQKHIENETVIITAIGGAKGEMIFPISTLNPEIIKRLAEHGLSQKLGDAAASTSDGLEAEEKIETCWNALVAGDWSTRAPASPKLTKKNIVEKLAELPEDEREATLAALAKLGIAI